MPSGFRVVATLVAALLVTGCTGPAAPISAAPTSTEPTSTPTPTSLPTGVEASLFQLRSDVAERGAQVQVVNESDEDLVITRLVFADDWFAGESVRERTSTIPAGRTINLGFALPESACEDEPDTAERTSRVTFEFSAGDQTGTATVDVADTLGFTELLHRKECLRHDLAAVATLAWTAFTASAPPLPAELQLAITPAGGGGTAQLIEVQTTNLLQFAELPMPFPLGVPVTGADPPFDVSVPILPLRCDAHAVMEDKRGTVFNVTVQVEGDTGVVEVAAPEAMRGEVLRWVADWCGFGPG